MGVVKDAGARLARQRAAAAVEEGLMTATGSGDAGARAFPEGFVWGAATAAYQIEGAVGEDGRTPSVWDTFSHTAGKVRGGDTGDVACDSYHRYRADVALMADLNIGAYRFSISWPRVQPGGRGPVNQKGLDYYRALVDELAEAGIAAAPTLYHWDLPQELQDAGGWAARETAERFAEYAAIVGEALGDGASRVITLNEPQVVAHLGYRLGIHAPGLTDPAAAAAATHHLLLGHGLATAALRSVLPAGVPVGITLDLQGVRIAGERAGVEEAFATVWALTNGVFLEPLMRGAYPAALPPEFRPDDALVRDGDFATITAPIDFLGVNYYAPLYLRRGDVDDLRAHELAPRYPLPGVVEYRPPALDRTSMDWLVDPDALRELLVAVSAEAPGLPLFITENGCAAEDYVNPDGVVDDRERIKYLHTHLDACAQAIAAGVPLAGYFVWSLLDNFEWAYGYQKRFGIVYVDFATQQRLPKKSGAFYAAVARTNALPPLPAVWPA